MDSFISFSEEISDIEVSIEIRASMRDVVSLLALIHMSEEIGIEEAFDLRSIYDSVMEQVAQYGEIKESADSDE